MSAQKIRTQVDTLLKRRYVLQVATKVYQLAATDLRLDDNYVLWYSNIARLIVTGVIPLGSLAYLNFRIYSVVSYYIC